MAQGFQPDHEDEEIECPPCDAWGRHAHADEDYDDYGNLILHEWCGDEEDWSAAVWGQEEWDGADDWAEEEGLTGYDDGVNWIGLYEEESEIAEVVSLAAREAAARSVANAAAAAGNVATGAYAGGNTVEALMAQAGITAATAPLNAAARRS